MRPLKLQIEGFTAFKDEVCLDFSQLDLFAITGPTGAGKSSLIDAIAYALYGRIPRVSNEVGSLISQGLDRMLVGLEFMAGEDRYRIFRETRRKGAGNIRLERWREDGWQAVSGRARDVNSEVAEIIGLDYDGFTRSVLLPQGQFQELLAGDAAKRRAVLASLLRLQVYESMRKRASGIAGEVRTRIEEREHTLGGLSEATEENVKRLEAELADAGDRQEATKAEIDALQHAGTLAVALGQSKDTLRRSEAEAQAALAEYQATALLLDEGGDALAQLDAEAENLWAQLATNCYDAERHTVLSVALERVSAVAQTQAELGQAKRRHDDASAQAAAARAEAEGHRNALDEATERRVTLEGAWSDAQRQAVAEQAKETERHQALVTARERVQALQQAQARLAQAEGAHKDAMTQAERSVAAVEKHKAVVDAAQRAREAADIGLTEAQRHDLAATLQQGLKPGDPCPVCGGVVGELSPLDGSNLEAAEREATAARKAETEARAGLSAASEVAARAVATAENAEGQASELRGSLELLARSLTEALPTGVEASVAAIDTALQADAAARAGRQQRLDVAEKQLSEARRQESAVLAGFTAASDRATRATATAENSEAQLANLHANMVVLVAAVAEVLPAGLDASVPAVEAELQAQVEARSARAALEARREAVIVRRRDVQQQVDTAQRQLAAHEQRSQAAADALEAATEAVKAALAGLEGATAGWPEVGVAMRGEGDAAAVLRRLDHDARELQTALVRSIGQYEERIKRLQADVLQAAELREGIAALKREHGVAYDLAQMLGAGKFQTYVQQEALRTLAACGSQRLEKLSGGRYKLQLDERGAEFEVVDLWNADLTRSVKTLSGGETFLASLALSLALAESLPSLAAGRRVVLDSIFLDEGFGSLDSEALALVADALDALRLENRMVCIVTHLPELAQRLPARIVVTKTEGGSTAAVA